tara:strand:- start:105422 stop:105583 length:162 start_codon:yes stop_codon:yes gene_type:complete
MLPNVDPGASGTVKIRYMASILASAYRGLFVIRLTYVKGEKTALCLAKLRAII